MNVLRAYSVKDEVIGYAQGINYLAAALAYTGMEEEVYFLSHAGQPRSD